MCLFVCLFLCLCLIFVLILHSFNDQGKMAFHGDAPEDYMTSVIGNQTINWLRQVTQQQNGDSQSPFFAYVAVHAPHVPATPAPWYSNTLPDQKAPRYFSPYLI